MWNPDSFLQFFFPYLIFLELKGAARGAAVPAPIPCPRPGVLLLCGRLSPSARSLPDTTLAGALQSQEGLSVLLGLTEKSLTPLWGLVLFYLLGKKTGPEVAPTPSSHLGPLLSLIFFPGFS